MTQYNDNDLVAESGFNENKKGEYSLVLFLVLTGWLPASATVELVPGINYFLIPCTFNPGNCFA